jgi:hypothetical protein
MSVVAACLLLASPATAFVAAAAVVLGSVVYVRPAVGAYAIIAVTPLVAGIDRGLVIPLLRPNEALVVLVAIALLFRVVPRLATEGLPEMSVRRSEVSLVLMAIAGSVLPLLWLMLRSKAPTSDDYLYALVIWKYYGLYVIIRSSVRTEREVRRCIALAMGAAAVVAAIAILQSLKLFGVPDMLSSYYTHFGNQRALRINRGSSTLSLPIAVADLMILNVGLAWGWLRRGSRHRGVLRMAIALFVLGTLASGQISGAIALVLCAGVIMFLAKDVRPIVSSIPVAVLGCIALWPVIVRRLQGFSSPEGLPESWVGRLRNLRTYFFPDLFSDFHFVLGVRPAARVQLSQRIGYAWIESGYTWLLWAGGLPFVASFLYFVWAHLQALGPMARARRDAFGIAATASVIGLVVIAVLMVVDPHLSYRGSADTFFALLALASVGARSHGQGAPSGAATLHRPPLVATHPSGA